MTGFFGIFSFLSCVGLLSAIAMGLMGSGYHLMVAMFSSVVAVSLHCLVFGIFTGAGKDTREISQELSLKADYYEKIKGFRKTNFPPALYAIVFLMMAIFLGGAVTVKPGPTLGWVHGLFAIAAVLYNIKTFRFEYLSIKENAKLLRDLNAIAAVESSKQSHEKLNPELDLEPVSQVEWGTHVYALGKFLCFLGINMFLPYLYTRFIMGMLNMPFWPFLALGLIFWLTGQSLKRQYKNYQPTQSPLT